MDRDEIAGGVDLLDLFGMDDHGGEVPGGIDGQVRVKAVDLHAQGDGRVGHQHADGAQADDAQGLAHQLVAGEGLLGLLGGLGDVLVLRVLLHPADAAGNIPGGQQHAAEHQLLDGVGVGAGGVEDDDAFLRAAVQRDVVDAGAGAGDGPEPGGEGHFLHVRGADQHAGRLVDGIHQGIAAAEPVGPDGGDIVQAIDFTVFHGGRARSAASRRWWKTTPTARTS